MASSVIVHISANISSPADMATLAFLGWRTFITTCWQGNCRTGHTSWSDGFWVILEQGKKRTSCLSNLTTHPTEHCLYTKNSILCVCKAQSLPGFYSLWRRNLSKATQIMSFSSKEPPYVPHDSSLALLLTHNLQLIILNSLSFPKQAPSGRKPFHMFICSEPGKLFHSPFT